MVDFEKLKQWMEVAQKYQAGDFWNQVFDKESARKFMQDMKAEQSEDQVGRPAESMEYPPVDIFMLDSQIVILIEIPGIDKRDIQLKVIGSKLTIKGISRLPFKPETALKNERVYGEFERTIELPEPTDGNPIRARFNHGLLVITYHKKIEPEEFVIIE
ncbi:Hsp20/alpha crystallin family protein [Bacillus timonensis]|uniref:Hsp20/alpha crystallin family protein n=1 Tax=Bacillus timonensis TaxID=1033734 RepID=A0A4S3PQT2_9BACI|nr:Hsp20/alpha crystallin family protein [Bacillus timonensis]THE11586.1 Hsp20/alpha crystallin family protein [Bacillus timonensis]